VRAPGGVGLAQYLGTNTGRVGGSDDHDVSFRSFSYAMKLRSTPQH
jgi:hypothetical protein